MKIWQIKAMLCAGAALLVTQAANAAISNVSSRYDATYSYYSFNYTDAPTFFRIYLDSDSSSATGFAVSGIGANYMIENGNLYRYSGSGGAWGWTSVKAISYSAASMLAKFTVARADIGNPTSLRYVANYSSPSSSSAIMSQSFSSVSPTPAPTATPASVSWVRCAVEGQQCNFSGTRQVRYGANGVYAYRTATSSIACNNATFGDPVYGVAKACDYSSSTSTTTSPTPTPTPVSTPAPTPAPTPTQSGSFVKPALVNPVNPMNYGAKCDGVTNDSAAFQAAVNASDVLVPAGRTCVINTAVEITMSNRHIECGAGAILQQNVSSGRVFNIRSMSGGRLTGDSIVNCHFIGTNTVAPKADWNDSGKHFNIPVQTQDRVDNFLLAGNFFERFWGQSMFQTYGTVDGGSGDKIIYNTFKSCGYYGPVFVAHTNGLIANNTLVDCAAGVENDNTTQYTGGNIIENNTLTCVYGYGGPDMQACTMLTGGVAGGASYRQNTVRNNSVSGVSSSAGFQGVRGSRLIIGSAWGVPAAMYSNNVCNNGCVTTP